MSDATKYTRKLASARILVIGGSSGIGYSVAEACLEHGAHVIISSSSASRISTAVNSLLKTYPSAKDRLASYPCDLASPNLDANIKTLFSQCNPNGEKLDHIVFTAGGKLAILPLAEATLEQIQTAAMVRFNAPLFVAKHAAAHMNPGPASSITLTTGSVSEKPMPNWTVGASYATGLHGMMRNLALDLAPIRVNLISPGAVLTPLWDGMSKEQLDGLVKGFEAKALTGEMGKPEDVAEAYLYVMRDWNVSGSVISTNSGALLKG